MLLIARIVYTVVSRVFHSSGVDVCLPYCEDIALGVKLLTTSESPMECF